MMNKWFRVANGMAAVGFFTWLWDLIPFTIIKIGMEG